MHSDGSGQRLRVLHVAHVVKGGVGSYLNEVVPHQLVSLGADCVAVAAPSGSLQHFVPDVRCVVEEVDGVGRNLLDLIRFTRGVLEVITKFQPDVLHLHSSFAGLCLRVARLLGECRGQAIVYCPHGWAFNMDVIEPRKKLYAAIERALERQCEAIIEISAFERASAAARGLSADRHVVIVNGVSDTVPRIHKSNSEGKLRLLFVGRPDRQKGLDLLLAAMAGLKRQDVTLRIAGAGGRAYVADTEAGANADARIAWLGWLDSEGVAAEMAEAHALVMPSRWEGLSLVALEALRAGLPIIASDAASLPEIVTHSRNGFLFPSGDVGALQERLEQLETEQLEAMRAPARERFLADFEATRMHQQLVDLYRYLSHSSNSPVESCQSLGAFIPAE